MRSSELVVVMHGVVAARLRRDRKGRHGVAYDEQYASDPKSVPLSLSLPFQDASHGHDRCLCWLSSLLPDRTEVREDWARRADTTAEVFDLLSTPIGYDCAGAVQFCPPERLDELIGRPGGLEPLSDDDIASRVASMAQDPLRWADHDLEPYFSLGGAQNKLALHRTQDRWAKPYGPTPTTHILKPSYNNAPALAIVEHLCSATARRLGLDAVVTSVEILDDHPVAIIERYDRDNSPSGWARVHQEDMCQALNIPNSLRREADGGPGMSRLADAIQLHSDDPETDLRRLADGLLWALISVNRDAHARNYSIIHRPGSTRFAPIYDLNSSLAYSIEKVGERPMSMRYGSQFTVYSSNSNHSLIDTAVRLKLPPEWVIDRAEALAAATVDGFTAEIDNLPVDAHKHLRAEEFLNSLRIRSESVSKTAAANRLRLKTPTHPPTTQPNNATEYLLAALPSDDAADKRRKAL